jgi:hypothetical protein
MMSDESQGEADNQIPAKVTGYALSGWTGPV